MRSNTGDFRDSHILGSIHSNAKLDIFPAPLPLHLAPKYGVCGKHALGYFLEGLSNNTCKQSLEICSWLRVDDFYSLEENCKDSCGH